MSAATVRALALDARAKTSRARVWRPLPQDLAEIVVMEDPGGDIGPRMHPWFGINLVRSPAVVSLEARREVVINQNSIVLIPGFHLFGVRPREETSDPAVTLLLGGSLLEGLSFSAQAALVTDAPLGEELAALVAQWRRPTRSVEHASTIRSMLQRLAAHGTPLAARRPRRIGSLVRVRDYLRTQVKQPVAVEELVRLSGLTASYLIRRFHYEYGLPPHAYHLRLRLAAACELLTLGRAIASVAYECDFADQSHLSRQFKAAYGVTPATWVAGAALEMATSTSRPRAPAASRRSAFSAAF